MRAIPSLIAAVLVLATANPATSAQSETVPSVEAVRVSSEVVPARPGDEGPLRYDARPPADLEAYPSITPEPFAQPPLEVDNRPLLHDVTSGATSELPLPRGPFGRSASVAGRGFRTAVDEQAAGWLGIGSLSTADPNFAPWLVHVRIFGEKPTGGGFSCSGTLIDARHVITAGHCLHTGPGGDWMLDVSAHPGWDGDADRFGSASATQLSSWTNWTSGGDLDWDQGYVRLDRPVGFLAGWHGLGYEDGLFWWLGTNMYLTGWPTSSCWPGAPHQFLFGTGTFTSIGNDTVGSPVSWPCWFGGMSGGGVYYKVGNDSRYVAAVNSHGTGKDDGVTTSVGCCRLTATKFDHLVNAFIPAGYPVGAADYVPLNVVAEDAEVGQGIPGMSYRVANASYSNPPLLSYGVDVYLSTNDNISELDTLIESHSFSWDFAPLGQVTVLAEPVVPHGTTPGTWWTGVILSGPDADTSNNDTDGWDAAQIQVSATCPGTATQWSGGTGKPGWSGVPALHVTGPPHLGWEDWGILVSNAYPSTAYLILGVTWFNAPFDGGRMYPHPDLIIPLLINPLGLTSVVFDIPVDPVLCGVTVWWQVMVPGDPGAAGWRQTSQSGYVGMTFGQ